jgi:hypothetical protein
MVATNPYRIRFEFFTVNVRDETASLVSDFVDNNIVKSPYCIEYLTAFNPLRSPKSK